VWDNQYAITPLSPHPKKPDPILRLFNLQQQCQCCGRLHMAFFIVKKFFNALGYSWSCNFYSVGVVTHYQRIVSWFIFFCHYDSGSILGINFCRKPSMKLTREENKIYVFVQRFYRGISTYIWVIFSKKIHFNSLLGINVHT
jgi:hypothetical protein